MIIGHHGLFSSTPLATTAYTNNKLTPQLFLIASRLLLHHFHGNDRYLNYHVMLDGSVERFYNTKYDWLTEIRWNLSKFDVK